MGRIEVWHCQLTGWLPPCFHSLEKEKEAKGEGSATTPLLAGTRHRDLDQELGVVTGGALERLLVCSCSIAHATLHSRNIFIILMSSSRFPEEAGIFVHRYSLQTLSTFVQLALTYA